VTVKEAFEVSSNVGMAKLVYTHYADNPSRFIDHLKKLHFNVPTGIDLLGEGMPVVKTPKSRTWSATTLPWMAFGYEVLVSPLQTLSLYNAVANNGKMMKPYLVSAIQESGITVRENHPQALIENICSEGTLRQLKECLEGVCIEGTGKDLFKNSFYKVAGKTGTALVANGSRGYADHIYQSSFAGFFPADNPRYSCIVVIKNKPFAKKYYGAAVAGPVFKEVADKLMSEDGENTPLPPGSPVWKKDSSQFYYAGSTRDMKEVIRTLGLSYRDSAGKNEWGCLYAANDQPVLHKETVSRQTVPDVKGMGLKDALYLLETLDLRVTARGRGKVKNQSMPPGSTLTKNQTIMLELN
jgi:cell division protein FtsI (penicillin-binding protein 3)